MNPNDSPKESTDEENASVQNMENSSPNSEDTGPVEMPTDSFGDENNSTTNPETVSDSTTEPGTENTVDLNASSSASKTPSPFKAIAPPTPIGGPAIHPEKKKSKKLIIIVASVFLLAGVATAGYFYMQSLQPAAAPDSSEVEEEVVAPVETSSDVQNEIDTIQEDINAVNDEAFAEEPITDETLNAAQ